MDTEREFSAMSFGLIVPVHFISHAYDEPSRKFFRRFLHVAALSPPCEYSRQFPLSNPGVKWWVSEWASERRSECEWVGGRVPTRTCCMAKNQMFSKNRCNAARTRIFSVAAHWQYNLLRPGAYSVCAWTSDLEAQGSDGTKISASIGEPANNMLSF